MSPHGTEQASLHVAFVPYTTPHASLQVELSAQEQPEVIRAIMSEDSLCLH